MTEVVPVSIGKKYTEFMDQLKVIATGNARSVSSEVCKAIKFYIQSFEDAPMLVSDDKWENFISNANKKTLLEMNTLICELSARLMKEWNKKIERS